MNFWTVGKYFFDYFFTKFGMKFYFKKCLLKIRKLFFTLLLIWRSIYFLEISRPFTRKFVVRTKNGGSMQTKWKESHIKMDLTFSGYISASDSLEVISLTKRMTKLVTGMKFLTIYDNKHYWPILMSCGHKMTYQM